MANTFTEGLDPRELAWVTAAALPPVGAADGGRRTSTFFDEDRGAAAAAAHRAHRAPAVYPPAGAFGAAGAFGPSAAAGERAGGYTDTHAANGTRRTEDTRVRGHRRPQEHRAAAAAAAADAPRGMRYAAYPVPGDWEKDAGAAHADPGPAVVVSSPSCAGVLASAPTAPPMRSEDDGGADASTFYDARSAFPDAAGGTPRQGADAEPADAGRGRAPVREQIHFYNSVSSRRAGVGEPARADGSAGGGQPGGGPAPAGAYYDDDGGADGGAGSGGREARDREADAAHHVVLRGDPWSAVVTYDAALMLCLAAAGRRHTSGPSSAAAEFLQDGCRSLRRAFALQDRLVAAPGEDREAPREGAWEDGSEDEINAAVSLGGNRQRYLRKLIVEVDSAGVPASAFEEEGGADGASLPAAAGGGAGERGEDGADGRAGWVPARVMRMLKVCLPKKEAPGRRECSVTWRGQGNRQFSVDGSLDDQLELSLPPAEADAAAACAGPSTSCSSSSASGPVAVCDPEEICVAVGRLRGSLPMPAEVPYVTDKSHAVIMEPGGARVRVHVSVLAVQQSSQAFGGAEPSSQSARSGAVTACRISAARAYDVLLRVALRDVGFRPRRLGLGGRWAWLVAEFAAVHGVSGAHQRLALLYHLLGASTPTKDCVDAIAAEMRPMLQLRGASQLSAQENVQLTAITARVEALLATVLENFKSLDDARPSGFLEVPTSVRPDACLPALGAAVALHATVHDPLLPDSQKLLRDRLQSAAKRRYRQVSRDVEQGQRRDAGDGGAEDGNLAATADHLNREHDAVAELACRLRTELEADAHVASRRVLPLSIDIEALMGAQYAALFRDRLSASLRRCPPRRPTAAAVNMINRVADLEHEVLSRAVAPPPHAASPLPGSAGADGAPELSHLFMDFIEDWIADLQTEVESFCGRVRVPRPGYEHAGAGTDAAGIGAQASSPRRAAQHTEDVETVLTALTERLAPFETIINRWNDFSIALEDAIASVVRVLVERLEEQIYPYSGGANAGAGAQRDVSAGASRRGAGAPASRMMRKLKSVASRGREPGAAGGGGGEGAAAAAASEQPSSQHNLSPRKLLARRSMGSTKYCVGAAHAYVLNALKRIMMTLPSLEMQVRDWIGDVPRLNGRGKFGVRFAVVMGELQTQYATLLGAVVSRVAEDVFMSRHTSLRLALRAMFGGASPNSSAAPPRPALRASGAPQAEGNARDVIVPEDDVERMLQPTKGLLNDVIHRADEVLLPRVFVSFCRGLWDATGRDMQLYLEDLSEMRENKSWLQRCAAAAAMESMDEFFRSTMQERHELHERDLQDPPESVRKCHQQLVRYMHGAAPGNNLYTSFSVF